MANEPEYVRLVSTLWERGRCMPNTSARVARSGCQTSAARRRRTACARYALGAMSTRRLNG